MTLVLTDIKTRKRHGHTEFVQIGCPVCQKLVSVVRSSKGNFGRLLSHSPSQFRRRWAELCGALGLDTWAFTPYSLRRGGATFDFIQNSNFDRSLVRGRWQNVRTARIYVRQGEEMLSRVAFNAQQRARFAQLLQVVRAFVLRLP